MKKKILLFGLFMVGSIFAIADDPFRFPRPEFESGHQLPYINAFEPRSLLWEYIDVGILFIMLSFASWVVLKKRSRKLLLYSAVFSVAYFGFFREGCVCSVGSLQNVALALFDSNYAIPATVLLFFALPLLFALFSGRVFCSGVCPLGAIQELFVLKPANIPLGLQWALGIVPYLYLGLSVLFAATGSDFIICRYDPFVGIFRLGGKFDIMIFGGLLLLSGIFIARPYCRFLCPYGVMLGWFSSLSKKHLSITPSECINCKLCENSCPYNAIMVPNDEDASINKKAERKRLGLLLIASPLIIGLMAYATATLYPTLAKVHPKVALAREVISLKGEELTEENIDIETYRASGKPEEQLMEETRGILSEYKTGGWYLGGFLGLAFCIALIKLSTKRKRIEYVADRNACLSCGKCFNYCPVGKVDLDTLKQMYPKK